MDETKLACQFDCQFMLIVLQTRRYTGLYPHSYAIVFTDNSAQYALSDSQMVAIRNQYFI